MAEQRPHLRYILAAQLYCVVGEMMPPEEGIEGLAKEIEAEHTTDPGFAAALRQSDHVLSMMRPVSDGLRRRDREIERLQALIDAWRNARAAYYPKPGFIALYAKDAYQAAEDALKAAATPGKAGA